MFYLRVIFKIIKKKLKSRLHIIRLILKSNLSLNNKIIIKINVKMHLDLQNITYGLGGHAKASQIETIQAF